mgnify:FL=1
MIMSHTGGAIIEKKRDSRGKTHDEKIKLKKEEGIHRNEQYEEKTPEYISFSFLLILLLLLLLLILY